MKQLLHKLLVLVIAAALCAGVLSSCGTAGTFTIDATLSLEVGASKKLTLVNTTSSKTVSWESSDTLVATVSRTGTVLAVKAGTATITATAGDFEAKCIVTVTDNVDPNVIPATGIITTAAQLRTIGSNLTMLSRNYKLGKDIDFEGGTLETIGDWAISETQGGNAYSGTFDGQGFAIKNVTFTGGTNNKNTNSDNAIFGTSLFVNLTGTVRNLNLIDVKAPGKGFCAAIAAKNAGLIENCYVGGSQTNINASNGWDWNVPGGGLVAINETTGMIKTCLYNGPEPVGARVLVGWNFGTIQNCYAAKDKIAATASLTFAEGEEIDTGAGGKAPAGPSTTAALTDAELKLKASYVGFSADVWEMADGKMAYLKSGAGERGWAVI